MNQRKTDTSVFSTLRFILVGTSHPGNVGAAARAIKTMGFSRLVLVKPRFGDVLKQEEAIAFASGAQDILENALIVETLEEALEDCHFAAALSARLREFSPPIFTPRQFADNIFTGEHANCALVFGSERYGLSNEDVEQCHALINIPANPDYSSLNLAQAIQILAYECRMAILDNENLPTRDEHIGFHGEPASVDQIQQDVHPSRNGTDDYRLPESGQPQKTDATSATPVFTLQSGNGRSQYIERDCPAD